MNDDFWQARSAAFLHAFLPVRDWVARHAEAPLAKHIATEELGFANLHAVVTERRYLGNPVPALPEDVLRPLAHYLDGLPFYAPDLRPGDEGFARAAAQQFLVIETMLRPLATRLP